MPRQTAKKPKKTTVKKKLSKKIAAKPKNTKSKTSKTSQKQSSVIPTNLQESTIVFQGVKTHNLKDINITLPKNKMITITGVSGSGKSSLAFDTIYKEGQFRYIESLSSYLRQFFNLGERPDIDFCSGLSPAIAIEQNKGIWNARSTVGTLTEIDDYLRLLFAKLGDTYCYGCGKEIKPQSIETIMKILWKNYLKRKIYLLQEAGRFKNLDELTKFVKKNRNKIEKGKGFTRYLLVSNKSKELGSSDEVKGTNIEKVMTKKLDKKHKKKLTTKSSSLQTHMDPIEYFYLEEPNVPEKYFPIQTYGIYDRVTMGKKMFPRLKEDIIKILSETPKFGVFVADTSQTSIERFTDKMYCAECNVTYPPLIPQNFSPNRQEWACPNCHGIGEVLQADFDKLIDPHSPYIRSVLPWRDSMYGQAVLKKLAAKYDIEYETLRKNLPERFQHVVLEGDEELLRVNLWQSKYVNLRYEGIEAILKEQLAKGLLTVDFQAMLDMKPCPICNGAKLCKESLYTFITLDKKSFPKTSPFLKKKNFITRSLKSWNWEFSELINDGKLKFNMKDLHHMSLEELEQFLQFFQKHTSKDKTLTHRILHPLSDRTSTIEQLGLGYITSYRQMGTLSGGEIQRLRLAKQLGNKLTGIIYVLDEPTIGLSSKEIIKAIKAIKKLQAMGNTVIVVEHNEEFIKASDWVVEIGPYAGDFGGNVIFNGPYKDFLKSGCLTAQYLLGQKKVKVNFEHKPSDKILKIHKASKYNLQNIDIELKLGSFTILTWPSGSGKTTLMYTTLYRFLNEKTKFVQSYIRFQLLKKWRDRQKIITAPVLDKEEYSHYKNIALQEFYKDLSVETIRWYEEVQNLIYVDQTSIGKTPRSCPATFIWVFDKIRNMYAGTKQAKYLGFASGHFSFNSAKWACPACKGYGYKKIELQFLPDTYIPCELCKGNRYKSEVLDVKRHGKNIAQVLKMYVDEALEFFEEISHISEELQLMVDIGLGYLHMGQPAHTLSWWESQRLKLVKHLLKSYRGHTIYFLDEPTVGLHFADIEKLLLVLKKFLNNWDTILMIEHDQDILQFADEIIELDSWKIV